MFPGDFLVVVVAVLLGTPVLLSFAADPRSRGLSFPQSLLALAVVAVACVAAGTLLVAAMWGAPRPW